MAHTAIRVNAAVVAAALYLCAAAVQAQTVVKLPKNRYTPQQDVEIGRAAAAEVHQQYPILQDGKISGYLTALGDRLVAAAPPELKEPVYQYSFTPVNLKEINAFALPGGPMFVHRGMFDAAASEGEVAGVMAHELAHVLLRHGTANASKAQNPWLQLGELAGALGGAMVGGQAGSAIAQSSQFGLGTLLLKYSRDFEKQADLLGAQIMARAGYDPRALARMFETIAGRSEGGGAPQWLSSHPNPGNRTQYINKEAALLTIAAPADEGQFEAMKATLAALPPATTMRELAAGKGGTGSGGEAPASAGTPGEPLPRPSSQYRDINGGKVFQASVPTDWIAVPSRSSIKVVPRNGYGQVNGQTMFICGVEFGVVKAQSRDLQESTSGWLQLLAKNNPGLRPAGNQQSMRISQRSAIATPLVNPSPLGGEEFIVLQTTFLADGTLFYFLSIVPEKDAATFQEAFQRIGESIRLTEVR